MRTVTGLLLLLMAVAAASLTADQSDVDSQVRGPNRAYAPGAGRLILTVVPVPTTLFVKVVIKLIASDTEPESPPGATPTKILLVFTSPLTPAGGALIEATAQMTPLLNHPVPECGLARVVTSDTSFMLISTFLTGLGSPHVEFRFSGGPNWYYTCLNDLGNPENKGEDRDLDYYLKEMFPYRPPATFLLSTLPHFGVPSCITHYGEHVGQSQYAAATIQIWIFTQFCNIPDPPFPF